ncbi:MAG: tetratricopeptide repeat protein [Syntrophobacterales bacterium]|jgi:tetratricopeptide (TPR) repeat protein
MQTNRLPRLVYLVLIFVTLVVFHQLPSHDFINLDDDILVYENPHVHAGLNKEGIAWAFTTFEAYNYHPLTWLSHMLDCELFGLRPGMHHLTNLLFHLMNTALLLFVLRRMTGALWRSGFVAALFALHPLHVESVAWVAERKDLLSAFFWFLSIWAYARYTERPGLNRYLPVLLFFSLGLLAKPMVVTLPFVLLLLDFWPLGRTQFHQAGTDNRPLQQKVSVFRLVWEKIPLFALAAISIVVTFAAQQQGGALKSLEAFPLTTRIANALISYLSYIGKMIWPHNLAVYYPHSGSIPVWQAAGAGLTLICVTVLVIWTARKRPYLAVGWLWYLGTLVPVIGLVQVGSQAMADRYTYLPLVGLFIALAWGVPCLFAGWRHRQSMLAILATIVLVSFTVCTWLQLRHWQNSITLFQHTLQVTTNNHFAHNNLGVALAQDGRLNEAISHYSEALRLKPGAFEVHNNLANALAAQGSVDEAIQHYFEALRLEPDYDKAHNNLGNVLAGTGRGEEAIIHYSEAIKINPDYAGAHYNLANALAAQGSVDEAIQHYFEALRILPDWAGAHNNLGVSLEKSGKLKEAIAHYHEALRIRPDYAKARNNLERALRLMGESAGGSIPVVKLPRGKV